MKNYIRQQYHVLYILLVYITGILSFTLFRLILFLNEYGRMADIPAADRTGVMARAFLMGLRFDTVISGYILFFTFLFLSVMVIAGIRKILPYKVIHFFIILGYLLFFLLCAIDIPFFRQFFSRLSVTALQWADSPGFVAKMIIQEPRYFWTAIPLLVISIIFIYLLKKIFRSFSRAAAQGRYPKPWSHIVADGMLSVTVLLLLFAGIRGRLSQKSPIRVGTAYFSNYAFPNQLGLNPVFTFINSMLESGADKNILETGISDGQAIREVQRLLGIRPSGEYNCPLARAVVPDTLTGRKQNVVIVIMESMSTAKMGRYGNVMRLTPFLDSIARHGYVFDSIYTSGIHTYNGVYSTLFSYPTIYDPHPMKEVNMLRYMGISDALNPHGYQSIYFTTHDDQFDNIGGFLMNNNFGMIVSQKDYPRSEIESTLGVPDDVMFEHAVPKLDKMASGGQPFLAVFLTASDHGPYVIPDYFHPRQEKIRDQAVEYADWSLRKLVYLCSGKSWFEHTLFVFIADHGAPLDAVYDMPVSYHHSPLIFFSPALLGEPRVITSPGNQVDVFPTIMGILKLPYINNTLGIDLLKKSRPFSYFSSDDKIGVIGNGFFLVMRPGGEESLYRYRHRDTGNYIHQYPAVADSMKQYALVNMQVAQWMVRNRKTLCGE